MCAWRPFVLDSFPNETERWDGEASEGVHIQGIDPSNDSFLDVLSCKAHGSCPRVSASFASPSGYVIRLSYFTATTSVLPNVDRSSLGASKAAKKICPYCKRCNGKALRM